MNVRMVLYTLAKMLSIEGALLLLPAGVGLWYGERDGVVFAVSGICMILFSLLMLLLKPKDTSFYAREGLIIVALTWILWSLVGALPFVFTGAIPNYIDAIFETVSGFTTTGSTVLSEIEGLSHAVLFWRSFTHWVGGMGVLVFVLAIIPLSDDRSMYLLRAEVPGPTVGKLVPKAKKSAMILYGIYILLTLLEVIFLLFGGMNFFESLLHAFSTAGTGGFSTRNTSLAAFDSAYIDYVVGIFMILFGVNFNLYFFLIIRNFRAVFKSEELRAYLGLIAVAVAVITIDIVPRYGTVGRAFRYAFFQVSSVITTTGFVTADYDLWPTLSKMILMLVLVVGACAGSTGGGLKVSRIVVLLKEVKNTMQKIIHPQAVHVIKMDNKKVDRTTREGITMFLVLYITVVFASILLVSVNGFDFETSTTAVLTCIGNTGPGYGAVGPVENFMKLSYFSKIVLSFDMLLGRLEIIPIIMLFNPATWRNKF